MAVSTLSRRRDNLPIETTSFVGRRRELAEVRTLLSKARLVTVTGPGGVGKTRTTVRLAGELRRLFPDGVWMVELAPLDQPAMVVHAVAATLEVPDLPSVDPLRFLGQQLGDRRLLLVLDNCEHLLDECARTADALLRNCPQLRLLATSRQALGVAGEFVFNLAPLGLPEAGESTSALSGFDAVNLLGAALLE
jgi:predicted ATPase